MVPIYKIYNLEKSTSGLVVKIQNDRQKPVFRQEIDILLRYF